jgi:AraC family transcriptional regulator of adaptative response/methylated-DNA-[protein]-cysteine methyltransferase
MIESSIKATIASSTANNCPDPGNPEPKIFAKNKHESGQREPYKFFSLIRDLRGEKSWEKEQALYLQVNLAPAATSQESGGDLRTSRLEWGHNQRNNPMAAPDLKQLSEDYTRVEQSIRYIETNVHRQPDLNELAAQVGLSEYHFQRLFTRWAGISPKRFLQFLTREHAKALLAHSGSLLEATYASGLSGPGRLHDLFVQTEAVTPGEYKSKGAGVDIAYGFHPSPFGECLLALTGRGICFLSFVENDHSTALEQLRGTWLNARLSESPSRTAPIVERIFSPDPASPIPVHMRGTNFQIKVWEALLRLPPGEVTTYQALAEQVRSPGAARAVGNAVAHNPLAYLIPCHRVLQKTGHFGNYRYGFTRKKAILGWEMARAESA